MVMLGAPAGCDLLRNHFISTSAPRASTDVVALRNSTKLRLPQLALSHGDLRSHHRRISSALQPQLQVETEMTLDPSCPLPNIPSGLLEVTLLKPSPSSRHESAPLLVYVPGMDCTGQGIRRQLPSLTAAGYDIRCVFIPSDDRSSWQQLVRKILPVLEKEVATSRHLTVVGESFGACLAIRLAEAAPHIVSRLVLINPATNFVESNVLGSFAARTGLLAAFPEPLYEVAQDILLPLMVRKGRVSRTGNEDMMSPIDYVPARCAAWRFSMLNDNTGLSDREIQGITVPTLLFASAKDRLLWATTECLRLQKLLPNSKRIIMTESGHTLLFEDSIDLAELLERNGFSPPHTETSSETHHLQSRKHAVPDEHYDEMGHILEPWRILTSPYVTGAESLPNPEMKPKRPILFVGNHTMFGIYDSPVLVYELYTRGFRLRGLAHPAHWSGGVGPIFERYGNVKATKLSAYKLLKEGEDVLLFPGGAREVCKRKGEEYKLMWKETVDFVRMASRLNAIIVPFGILGADDAYKLLYDGDDILNSPLGPLVQAIYKRFGMDTAETIYPVTALPVLGIPSPLPIPSIERIYIHFAEPVDTQEYNCILRDSKECKDLYMLVKARVEDAITLLKQTRDQDPERSLPTRLLGKLRRLLPERKP